MTPFWFILVVPSIHPSVDNWRVIWIPLDGVILFDFQINVDWGDYWGQWSTLDWGEQFVAIHRGYYQENMLQVVDGYFCTSVRVFSGSMFWASVWFLSFYQTKLKNKQTGLLYKNIFFWWFKNIVSNYHGGMPLLHNGD